MKSDRRDFLLRARRRRRARRLVFSFLWLVLLFLLLVGAIRFSGWEKFLIDRVAVGGTSAADQSVIEAAVWRRLNERFFLFFPRKNVILYPRLTLRTELLEEFPRLASVKIGLTERRTLSVAVTERQPAFVWCDAARCFFLDESGFIFSSAPQLSQPEFFLLLGALPENPLGIRPLPVDFLRLIAESSERLAAVATRVAGEEVFVSRAERLDEKDWRFVLARTRSGEELPVIFDLSDSSVSAFVNLEAALTNRALHAELLRRPWRLEYIDLRFGSKVFYKPTG